MTSPQVVALGGGHGLHATLSALRHVVTNPTAVVTVADNGGSSGRLRGEFGVLPPGDLRMALAALCGDDEWGQTWARVLQHRFEGEGQMRGHVVGNLLIVSLWELLGDHVAALRWVARLLGAEGTVLPMAITPMDINAEVRGVDQGAPEAITTVRGQVEVATTDGQIVSISLDPADPVACPEAVAAVRSADWVVLGPGSWYSSVIPHLMVPALREALVQTDGRLVVVLNLEGQAGETHGYAPEDHLAVLHEHAPDLKIHTVLADAATLTDAQALEQAVASWGAQLEVADVALDDGSPRHDTRKLAAAFRRILGVETGPVGD
ncbi:MAG: gluconeogenesis factor YvcK family protein [Nocardioides sp.]